MIIFLRREVRKFSIVIQRISFNNIFGFETDLYWECLLSKTFLSPVFLDLYKSTLSEVSNVFGSKIYFMEFILSIIYDDIDRSSDSKNSNDNLLQNKKKCF